MRVDVGQLKDFEVTQQNKENKMTIKVVLHCNVIV